MMVKKNQTKKMKKTILAINCNKYHFHPMLMQFIAENTVLFIAVIIFVLKTHPLKDNVYSCLLRLHEWLEPC